jgi:hypothetical protein
VLRATGDPAAAVAVGRDLARALIARFGATDRRTLAAHADLAVTLYAAGECLSARQILHRTGEVFRQTYGPDDPLGVRMSDRFAALTRACSASDVEGVARAGEIVAEHVCGRPDRTLSVPTADLFLDLFAFSRIAPAESSTVDPAAAVVPPPVAVPTAVKPEPVEPESVEPEPVEPEPVEPEPVEPESVEPDPVAPEPAEPTATTVDRVEPESVEREPVATAVDAAGPEPEDADRDAPDAAVADATGPASVARDRPAVRPAGPLTALAMAIPAARRSAARSEPDLVEADVTPVPAPTVAVPMPSVDVGDTLAADAQVMAAAVAAAPRSDEPSVEAVDLGVDGGADTDGSGEPRAGFGGDAEPAVAPDDDRTAHEPPMPMWADRPTAGYPTVPVATGLHPTWVTASEVPLAGIRPMDETSTVAVVDEMVADGSLTHSRATFGRMRRRSNHSGVTDCPQRTATACSTKTTDGE